MCELYKRGVLVVAGGKTRRDNNIYYIGDWDHPESGKPITHEELMAMIREKI